MDLSRQYRAIQAEVDAAVSRVLERALFILGEEVASLERECAAYLGAKHAVAVASGTSALHLAMLVCGVRPGDEVITVPNTAVPTVAAIEEAGARPVFVDVEPRTALLDPGHLEAAFTLRTRAVLPVHLYGAACRMQEICDIAVRRGIPVIEDACQAVGAEVGTRKAGTFGMTGCFSFYPTKNLGAYGDGGLVVTDDDSVADRLLLLRNYGQRERNVHEIPGFNSRLDELQAAILRVKLPHLGAWNARRREITRRYRERIRNPQVTLPPHEEETGSNVHHFVVRCRERNALQSHLTARGIGTLIHYPTPIHLQPAYRRLGYGAGAFPVAERLAGEILSLPMFPELTDGEADKVADAVNEFAGR